jgi:hypothetical protein
MISKPRKLLSPPLIMAAAFFSMPVVLYFLYPASFWLGTDNEPLGLTNALNMAYRLADARMYPALGASNHPGVTFYLMNWIALALAGFPVATGGLSFFNSVLDHVETYHVLIVCLAALIGAAGVYLFAHAAGRVAPAGVAVAGLLVWLVSSPASILMFMSPGFESFALLVNALFLAVLLPIAREKTLDPAIVVFAGCVGALAYLNKLSYIYIPMALLAAMVARLAFSRTGWVRSVLSICLFVVMLVAVVVAAGFVVLGWDVFLSLLAFHKGVILGSGMYGNGEQTVVSSSEVWRAIGAILPDRAYAVPIALSGGAVVAAAGIVTGLRRPEQAAAAVVGTGAGIAALFAATMVMKHYDLHYTAGVSATLPALVVAGYLLLRAFGLRAGWSAAIPAVAILLMAGPVARHVRHVLIDASNASRELASDMQQIASHMAGNPRAIDFVYRAPFRQYGEGFIVKDVGVPRLLYEYLRDRRGVTNSFVEHLVTDNVGAWVIDKNYFRSAEAVKAAENVDLLGARPVRYNDGDKLIELKTVFLLIRH